MLRHPHLIFVIPDIVGFPHFQSDGVLATGFGDENSFGRVGNLRTGDDHDFLRDSLVDENPIALAHDGAIVFSRSSATHSLQAITLDFARQWCPT